MRKIDKILEYIESQDIKISVFEKKAGLGNSYLNNTKKRGEDISAKKLDEMRQNLKAEYYKIFPEEKKNHAEEDESDYKQKTVEPKQDCEKLKLEVELLRERLEDKETAMQAMRGELESLRRLVDLQDYLLKGQAPGQQESKHLG